jgi:hypothetical protein
VSWNCKKLDNLFLQSMTQISTFSCKFWIEIEKNPTICFFNQWPELLLSLVNFDLKLKKPNNLFLQSMTQISTFSCKLWIQIDKTQQSVCFFLWIETEKTQQCKSQLMCFDWVKPPLVMMMMMMIYKLFLSWDERKPKAKHTNNVHESQGQWMSLKSWQKNQTKPKGY